MDSTVSKSLGHLANLPIKWACKSKGSHYPRGLWPICSVPRVSHCSRRVIPKSTLTPWVLRQKVRGALFLQAPS